MDPFKSHLTKILKEEATKGTDAKITDELFRLIDPKDFEEHKTKTAKAFKATFVTEEAIAIEKLRRIDNWPTLMMSGGLGLQFWENHQTKTKEWRVFYKDCSECAKPIYGKWHISPLELAKEIVNSPAPECQICKPLCPLKAGMDTHCPQKRGKYGCQWWLTEKQGCAVEMIGLKSVARS